jgi:hypothetical protein
MKQIFKSVLGTILIILFLAIIYTGLNSLQAEEKPKDNDPPKYNNPGIINKPVPVYCGQTDFMLDLAAKKFNQQPLVAGTVIVPATGRKIAVLSVFVNKDNVSDMSVLMTMLDTNETCVLGYGKNLKFYEGGEET